MSCDNLPCVLISLKGCESNSHNMYSQNVLIGESKESETLYQGVMSVYKRHEIKLLILCLVL